MRKSFLHIARYSRNKLLVSVELTSKDWSYHWFLSWMGKNVTDAQQLSIITQTKQTRAGKPYTQFEFHPSFGTHFINYKGHYIKVERAKGGGSDATESINLTTIGRNKQIIIDLLHESKKLIEEQVQDHTIVYNAQSSSSWVQFGSPRSKRPFDSVILDKDLSESLYLDVKQFMDNHDWYVDRGIPYRRGYLLYGPPGCGKSSYIVALAGKLNLGICVMSLSEVTLTDDKLNQLLVKVPENSIVLLEDIDAAFTKNRDSLYRNSLTFSGCLNALDGASAAEGRILFMTTNFIEKLDEALIRPGRIDRKEYIGYATKKMLKLLYCRFHPKSENLFDEKFDGKEIDELVSMAAVQSEFISHKNDPVESINSLEKLIEEKKKRKGRKGN